MQKTTITKEQKELLEQLSGQTILLKNTWDVSHESISRLMQQGLVNATEYLERNQRGHTLGLLEENNVYKACVELQHVYQGSDFPHRIECFDISHLQGTFVYGSMVVFVDGRPAKKFYRLFKTKQQNNDFANLAEVIRRRIERAYKHALEEDNPWRMPDLMIIDGGKGQLSSVMDIVTSYTHNPEYQKIVSDLSVIALAKREELVFLPGISEPKEIETSARFLIQRIRDETHRFGITANRKARLKTASKSELESIDGVGKITSQKLLQEFGSVTAVINALWDNRAYVYKIAGESVTHKLLAHFGVK